MASNLQYRPLVWEYLSFSTRTDPEAYPPVSEAAYNLVFLSILSASYMGDSYWWSPEMCRLIAATYKEMPPLTLTREILPAPFGFFWFADPFDASAPEGETPAKIRCAMWSILLPPQREGGPPTGMTTEALHREESDESLLARAMGIEVVIFTSYTSYTYMADAGYPTFEVPTSFFTWQFGHTQAPIYEDRDVGPEMEARAVATAFALLNQRVLVSPRHVFEDRQALKRIARLGDADNTNIRIVALRKAFRRLSGADRQGGDPVDWSCQWLVGGHWRQQWYPSLNAHQPIYIAPYWKGPEDKPVKAPSIKVGSVHR